MRVTLESGEWIDILPIQRMRAKHKDKAEGAIKLYVSFDKDGKPDMSGMPLDMSIMKIQRNALLAMLVTGWSFTACQYGADDEPIAGTEGALPVPYWDNDRDFIVYEDSYGELPIDDMNEIEGILAPYLEKIKRKPDPKGTTTDASSDGSPAKASRSRKG